MRTDAQIEASRHNGAKSQGPVTPEGKHRSSQNATKHGLSARVVVLDCEDHDLFDQLEQDYITELQPHTTIELHLVQRIAAAEWRIRRAQGIATAILDESIQKNKESDHADHPRLDNDMRIGLNFKRVERDLAPIERAEARLERLQARAMAELRRLRKERSENAQPIPATPKPDLSTTGRDPSQYLFPKPEPNEPDPTPPPAEPEPCIVIPPYPIYEDDPFEDPPAPKAA